MEIPYMPIVTANISNFTLQDSDAIQIENYINCASNYRGFSKWFLDSNNDKKKKRFSAKQDVLMLVSDAEKII